MLFKSSKSWLDSAEDRGYPLSRPASSVSHHTFYPHNPKEALNVFHTTLPGWTKKAERIHCPAPLPEEPAVPLLTKMLVPAP